MKNTNLNVVVIICLTSAFIIDTLLVFVFYDRAISPQTIRMLKDLLVFFSLLLITASITVLYRSVKRTEKTYYSKNLYNTILENTNVGLAILDENNKFEFINTPYKNLLQLDHYSDIDGQSASAILPKSIFRFIMEYRLLPEETPERSISQTIHFKDLHIDHSIFRIEDGRGSFKYVITAQNQTEFVHMEEKLKDQLKEIKFHMEAKESLLANISHELKTPLNAIIGLSHILDGTELTAKQKELVSKINASSDFLLSLINDVLDFSKIKHGTLSFCPSHFILNHLLADIRKIFYPITVQQNIELQEDYDFEPNLCLHLDKLRLEQVLVNLINNAIKFTEVGYVKLSVSVLQELQETVTLKFIVEDTGIGIDYEDIPSLFTEFQQLENHLTKLHQGTGLGLPICKYLVENMGGSLWVESKKGIGSKFFFTITAPKSYEVAAAPDAKAPPVLYGHGEKVLVVEDTLINYEVVEELLSEVNISCDHAANGIEAIELCEEVERDYYKAILMDIHMPQMDGYEASRRIKELGVTSPILALTASNIDVSTKEQYADLIDDFIFKPFKYTQLYDALTPYFEDMPAASHIAVSNNSPRQAAALVSPPQTALSPSAEENPFSEKETAIENLGGNIQLYEKHLARFKRNYVEVADTIKEHIDSGDLPEAKRLSHSVKGLAAMLGMPYLTAAAKDLEEAIEQNEKDLNPFLLALQARLAQVLDPDAI